jgi:hypothetical protein
VHDVLAHMDICYFCIIFIYSFPYNSCYLLPLFPRLNLKIHACMQNTLYIHVFVLPSFSFNNLPSLSTMSANWSFVFWNQNVSLARRFALVPLGPPLLAYCSNCKAMLSAVDGAVELVVDRPYKAGDPIVVWYNACFIWHHVILKKDVVIFVLVASL